VLDQEEAFELAPVAVCLNGWFYFLLGDLQEWFTEKGFSHKQAAQLVMGNMQDCLASAQHQPRVSMEALGRCIPTPGTFTSAGLEKLRKNE
jgi:pyrroline-5-carboxylate reductase